MGKIFYIMGKSSSGKDTIYKKLLSDSKLNLKSIVMYTTRPIREGETNGVEYFFVRDEELEKLEKEGKVIEIRSYNTVHGVWRYFTVNDNQINLKKNSYLMIGTVESYNRTKDFYGGDVLVPIYIEVDDGIRLARALRREQLQSKPTYEEMCRRFLADQQDFSNEKLLEARIVRRFSNIDLKESISQITDYINKVVN